MTPKIFTLTFLTMAAFAANSIFCRLALTDTQNDPTSFTVLRLISGALILSMFYIKQQGFKFYKIQKTSFIAPFFLFTYAFFFSLAYVKMDAGSGALILFTCVQITMITFALLKGQRFNVQENIGMLLALLGLGYLLLPGSNAPVVSALIMMVLSGISWGAYSLLGKGSEDPGLLTAQNFILTTPACVLVILVTSIQITPLGILWAVLSGALTSGLGYLLWYKVLKSLSTSTAAIVQLSVPALAAMGGVLFLNEQISMQLLVSSVLIFTGIFIKVRASSI